jgi:preprotein translocase subunit YajC
MTLMSAMLLQAAPGGAAAALGKYWFLIELAMIMAIFYFLMIRPQQQQRLKHEAALREIKKGDDVVTAGGLVGRVIHIRETVVDGSAQRTMEDRVTIETGESRVVVERGRIAKIGGVGALPPTSKSRANPTTD